ncbi:MAG: ribosomal protein S18-alanine N-acetyltransferase [Myxococcota bacterium]
MELDDAAAIARVEALAASEPWREPQVRDRLLAPSTRGWVARHGAAVIGHLLASSVAEEGEILTLAVAPEARRQGVARQLVVACTDGWRRDGVRDGWLEVRHDNAPAIALYRATGWAEAGRRARYYRDGADALVMRWQA